MSVKTDLSILDRFSQLRVAVLGDVMLDVYAWGQVNRISPEAPVPVVSITRRTSCLGGAANVMRNLATLGAASEGFGVIGNDATGRQLIRALEEAGITSRGILQDPERPTTEKCRIMASGQQLLRIDEENIAPVSDELRRKLVNAIIDRIRQGALDAIIFEDYAKGLLSSWMLEEIVSQARQYKIPTALDPKPGGLEPVKGLTFIKPNRLEAFAMAKCQDKNPGTDPRQDPALREAADHLLALWEPEHLLISLASQGMALFSRCREMQVIPTRAQEVFDVSGAGDTVTASYTLALAGGASPADAAEIANLAASVVVAKVGTAPIYFNELQKVCQEEKF